MTTIKKGSKKKGKVTNKTLTPQEKKKIATDRTTATNKAKFIEAFSNTLSNVSMACKKIGISRNCYYEWRKIDPEFTSKCDEVSESIIDLAETMLLKKVKEGSTAELIFFLKTKGKSRGYTERTEVETRQVDEFSELSDAQLESEIKKLR